MDKKQVIYVKMFGNFVLTFNGTTYNMNQYLNKQPLNLLQFLMLNHQRVVSNEELYDALWSESKNPQSALKFAIHTLRSKLQDMFQDHVDWIVSSKGGYCLTEHYKFILDTDQLSDISKQLESKVDFDQKDYKLAMEVMDIYTGHLFMTSSHHFWVTQLAEWYCSSFANVVGRICKYLIRMGEYELMIKTDYQAILKEPFYEGLHYFYIQGLIKTQEYHKALQYYDEINEAFYKELGTGLSPKFKELYDILEEENKVELLELSDIKQKLDEYQYKEEHREGFYCTFDMFNHIYELSSKVAQREGKNYYLILFSVMSKVSLDRRTKVVNGLRNMILVSIRSSDICAKVNDYQFILLVSCTCQEDTHLIVQRISQRFYRTYSSHQFRLNYSIEDIKNISYKKA